MLRGMGWEQTASDTFVARHDTRDAADAERVLAQLERWRQWAWLVEGGAQWLSGQTRHVRPAVARRMHEGPAPAFPPARPDALLLGGTVYELLAREEGERACVALARGPHPNGPRAALERAFGGRRLRHTEEAWRSHLARVTHG